MFWGSMTTELFCVLLTLQILKSFLLGQKAYVEQRVEAIRWAQFVWQGRSLRYSTTLRQLSRFASLCFLEVRQSDSRVDW
jgi:hypothetical protein